MQGGGRRLAAIMFTDIVGYTALAQKNEDAAMNLLEEHRSVVRPFFPRHGGREVKTIGDAFLVEFDSALEAVRCAYDISEALHELNSNRPPEREIRLRIGIHLGDVIQSQNDVYGDAVNVASRIEPLAPPGGICISEEVYSQVKNKFQFPIVTMGKKNLKNVSEEVEVFRIALPWEDPDRPTRERKRNRVAVLPFANMSPDRNDEYFSDGVTEELIDKLCQIKELEVIARTTVMSYKGEKKNVGEIARELEVGSLVEGSVRKAGNKVRVSAQLIDGATQGHLWSSHFDGMLDDIFAVQSEIAEKVAAELKVHLLDSEKQVLERKPTDNLEAYSYFLRAKELLREGTEPSLRQALALFENVVSMDPRFARAHLGAAESVIELVNEGYEPFEEGMPKAERALEKALQLDPDLAEAHSVLAQMDFQKDRMKKAEQEARRAIQLNPSLPEPYRILSSGFFVKGDTIEGLRGAEMSYQLDPARPRYVERIGRYYFYLGRESEAIRHWERTVQVAPAATYRLWTEYFLSKQDIDKAEDFYEKATRLEPTNRWNVWMGGFLAARRSKRDEALKTIDEIQREKWVGSDHLNELAFVYFALDDMDNYFANLEGSVRAHGSQWWQWMYSPLFAKGREDPRYQKLLDLAAVVFES